MAQHLTQLPWATVSRRCPRFPLPPSPHCPQSPSLIPAVGGCLDNVSLSLHFFILFFFVIYTFSHLHVVFFSSWLYSSRVCREALWIEMQGAALNARLENHRPREEAIFTGGGGR